MQPFEGFMDFLQIIPKDVYTPRWALLLADMHQDTDRAVARTGVLANCHQLRDTPNPDVTTDHSRI